MHSVGIRLKSGRRPPMACNNPCNNQPADNQPWPGRWKTAESNFRFHFYRIPISCSATTEASAGAPVRNRSLRTKRLCLSSGTCGNSII
jgi:hypothetical protein